MTRRSIYIKGFAHSNPIPAACQIGDLLVSVIITGVDPGSGKMPSTMDEQCAFMFQHIRAVVEAGGCNIQDIAKITIWLADRSDRRAVNHEWLSMFPDPDDRPARQTMETKLNDGKLVQCDFLAARQTR